MFTSKQHQLQQGPHGLPRLVHICLLLLSLSWAANGSNIVEPEEAAFQGAYDS